MVKELCEKFDQGYELARYPYEMLDENKFLAARHGLEGTLVDLPDTNRVPTADLVRRVVDRLRPARRGARVGWRTSTASTTCSTRGTAQRGRWSSSRPITTCAR